MPAQVYVSAAQIAKLAEVGHDVIITEATAHAQTLDCWILDEESMQTDTHRSMVLEVNGDVLGDTQLGD